MLPTFFVSDFAQQIAALAVAAIWQGLIVAGGVAVCLRLVPRTSAEQRFTLWAAAFATIVSLPLVTLIADFSGTITTATTFAPATAVRPLISHPLLSLDARWSIVIAALWSIATLFRAGDLVLHSIRLRKIWKEAAPVELESSLDALLAATPAGKKRWPVEVCTTTTLQRPSVIGFFKPRILIPDWLFARLTAGELEQIVLHEAEHLRRRDDWTNLFQKLCLVLFPLNPALVWIERRLCREREMACDDGVIAITRAPRAYAACLTSLAERGLQRRAEALSLGAWQRRPELVHRVHSILRRTNALGPVGGRILLGALGCGLLFGSVVLARCPQLVAFVSAPKPDAATRAVAGKRATASVHLVNASYIHASYNAGRKTTGGRPVSVARSEGRVPVPSAVNAYGRDETTNSHQRNLIQQNVVFAGKTPSDNANSRSVMLKAEMPTGQPVRAQEQQWLVLTAWEQVETPSQNAGVTADYDTATTSSAKIDVKAAATANASGNGRVQPTTPPAGQIIVTRLIVKIYPASSVSTQPTTLPIRGGWFVLQL